MSSVTEHLLSGGDKRLYNNQMPPLTAARTTLLRQGSDVTSMNTPMFEELPKATILSVSRPDVSDITNLLLSYTYTIEVHYKQVIFLSPLILLGCITYLLLNIVVESMNLD